MVQCSSNGLGTTELEAPFRGFVFQFFFVISETNSGCPLLYSSPLHPPPPLPGKSQVLINFQKLHTNFTCMYRMCIHYLFMLGVFWTVDQKVWYEFSTRIFQVANKNAFLHNLSKRGQHHKVEANFLKISYREFLFHLLFPGMSRDAQFGNSRIFRLNCWKLSQEISAPLGSLSFVEWKALDYVLFKTQPL